MSLKGNETKDIEVRFNTTSYNNYVEIFYAEGGIDIIELSVERVNGGDDDNENGKIEEIEGGVKKEGTDSANNSSNLTSNIEGKHHGALDKAGLEKLLLQAYVQEHREIRFNKISYARNRFLYLASIFLIVTGLLFFSFFGELIWGKCRG